MQTKNSIGHTQCKASLDYEDAIKKDDIDYDLNTKSSGTKTTASPTTNPDAATLHEQNIYDNYLYRLNEKSEFSKTLIQQKANVETDEKDEKQKQIAERHTHQSLSETERARIRERYSEKAKERRLRMYEKAILLAEEREREEGKRYRSQRQIHFKITYQTCFGQNILVVGSVSQLGDWDAEKGIPLTWCPGNLWTGTVTLSVEDGIVEYKYVVKDTRNCTVIWEPGYNHKIDVCKLPATTTLDNTWGISA